jgi:transposase InsO family protein
MQLLIDIVLEGWPTEKTNLATDLRVYWNFRDEISVIDGLLFKGPKVIVPFSLRAQMLEKIHEGHLGIVKCKQRARDVLYWPGLARDIEEKVSKCQTCSQRQRQQPKEPLLPHEPPNRPWAKIATDLFELDNQHYLCTVDYYSKWIEVDKLDSQYSSATTEVLKQHFSRYGIPDEVVSDNGPQFSSSEFAKFAKDYEFSHSTSSPHYPQANGQVERSVQTVKNLMRKSKDINKALLSYRNTSLEGINMSPAQLLMGRRLKTTLPTTAELLKPPSQDKIKEKLIQGKENQKRNFDLHVGKELEILQKGETVRMKHGNTWVPAVVSYKHFSPRSYVVKTEEGRSYRRNRRQLNKCYTTMTSTPTRQVTPIVSRTNSSPQVELIPPPATSSSHPSTPERPSQQPTSPMNNKTEKAKTDTQVVPETVEPTVTDSPSTNSPVITRSGRTVKRPSHLKDFVSD